MTTLNAIFWCSVNMTTLESNWSCNTFIIQVLNGLSFQLNVHDWTEDVKEFIKTENKEISFSWFQYFWNQFNYLINSFLFLFSGAVQNCLGLNQPNQFCNIFWYNKKPVFIVPNMCKKNLPLWEADFICLLKNHSLPFKV